MKMKRKSIVVCLDNHNTSMEARETSFLFQRCSVTLLRSMLLCCKTVCRKLTASTEFRAHFYIFISTFKLLGVIFITIIIVNNRCHKIVTSERPAAFELAGKDHAARSKFDRQTEKFWEFENCQRIAFKNSLRQQVPDGGCHKNALETGSRQLRTLE